MAPLVRIASHLRAIFAAHVAFEFVDRRRRLRTPHDVERDRLVRVATEASDFEIAVPGIDRIAQRRRRCADPLKASMHLFQASQASLSASRRASAARSAAIRTEVP
jgi:hypothetical protein